ncbi:helix-turn-helix domain-containing protein [Rhodococcus sp. IEGM 1408]|uniref:helix-turn-helix domain-containing protein n=1 Tax=Rhodococcus sp. IEGM 1408 TaxID=3082220 RepID=UPI0029546102|nr:helix-turn-helix domain-containing protein [Rhodococcus sp. IEGM 1408]MDV8000764.1 helix-turn-helix domain-containing protein [Rhodococcus sp. IEGM 1408]
MPVTTSPSPRRLVSIASAAEVLDVHPKTVRRYISAGRLTAYRLGTRTLRVDAAEVEAFARPIATAADSGNPVR